VKEREEWGLKRGRNDRERKEEEKKRRKGKGREPTLLGPSSHNPKFATVPMHM